MVAILHDAIGVPNLISRKCSRRGDRNKRLTILSEAEKLALYGLPNFDDFQRVEFFAMTDGERSLALRRNGLPARVYCLLQIGYFKAKQAFFRFSLSDVPPDDIAFLLQRYFLGQAPTMQPLSAKEYYAQRKEIAVLFGYRLWSASISLERTHGISDRSAHRAARLHHAANRYQRCALCRTPTSGAAGRRGSGRCRAMLIEVQQRSAQALWDCVFWNLIERSFSEALLPAEDALHPEQRRQPGAIHHTAVEVECHGERAQVFGASPALFVHRLPAQMHLVDGFFGEELAGRKQGFLRHDAERLATYRTEGRGVFERVVHIVFAPRDGPKNSSSEDDTSEMIPWLSLCPVKGFLSADMRLSAWPRTTTTDNLRRGGCREHGECEICHPPGGGGRRDRNRMNGLAVLW